MNVLRYIHWIHSQYCTEDDKRRVILWNLLNFRLPTDRLPLYSSYPYT
jgi:hypothetical protein